MFTPVIGVTRVATEKLYQTSTCTGISAIHTIPKGEHIAPSQNLAARSPLLFPDTPNEFHPERHKTIPPLISLPWHPFGGAHNPCTGTILYNLLAETLFTELLGKYKFTTDIKHEVEQTGSFITKLKEPIYIKLL
ncbi:MAG: cytochrome P450 [Parachlamydiaceae bacterium]|nr:cytochrome P450 [Parachlamydiaceae bacterium]